MKANQAITCPACGEKSIAKAKTLLDGFRPAGEVLVCMLCGAELGKAEDAATAPAAASPACGALAALLGGGESAKPTLRREAGEGRFCRDCDHYLVHPFLSRCTLKQCEVNPMDDCPQWRPKKDKSNDPKIF